MYWVSNKRKDPEWNNRYTHDDIVYVTSKDSCRGHKIVHGIFLSNWESIPDIHSIIIQLVICSDGLNTVLNNLLYAKSSERMIK